MSRSEFYREGRVPLHTLRANIDYGFYEAKTTFGRIGVKVWIYKGDVSSNRAEREAAQAAARMGVGQPQRARPPARTGSSSGPPRQPDAITESATSPNADNGPSSPVATAPATSAAADGVAATTETGV
jgi:small subunit ribosomal protein S3